MSKLGILEIVENTSNENDILNTALKNNDGLVNIHFVDGNSLCLPYDEGLVRMLRANFGLSYLHAIEYKNFIIVLNNITYFNWEKP